MSISLGISWNGIPVRNSEITIVSSERFTVKLEVVVQNKGVRDPESCDNVLPNELLGIHVSDISQRFGLDPFGEIVDAEQKISLIPHCLGERANNI